MDTHTNPARCRACGRKQTTTPFCPDCGEPTRESPCCHGGIVGAGEDGYPIFCEKCLAGLTLGLDWLAQRMSVVGQTLEYAPADALYLPATERLLEELITEHDRLLVLYERMDGYNARTNPDGRAADHVPYWPKLVVARGV
jgi:hypothetical protein